MKIFALIITMFIALGTINAQLGNISKLPLDTVFIANSVVPYVDTTGGNTAPRAARVKDIVANGLSNDNFESSQEYTTGDTLVVSDGVNIVHINPADTVASLVIVLSDVAHADGWVHIFFSEVITALEIIGDTNTVFSPTAVTTANAGDVLSYKEIGTVYFRKP